MKLNYTLKCINEFGKEKKAELKEAMLSHGSKTLYNTLSSETKENINSIILSIFGDEGIYYFSEGRAAGKFPPIQTIKDWAKRHDLDPFRDKRGRFITFESRAFLIARHIAVYGTKDHAIHFLFKIWKLNSDDKRKFMSAYKLDIKEELTRIVDVLNKQ